MVSGGKKEKVNKPISPTTTGKSEKKNEKQKDSDAVASSSLKEAGEVALSTGDGEILTALAVDPFTIKYDHHTIGYETESWAVRKYRTNEMSTARRGIDDNIQEFLENDLGYIPDHSYEDVRLWIMAISLGVGVFAHSHNVPFAEAHSLTLGCIFAYYFCVLLILYIGSFLEGDHLLVAKTKLATVPHPRDRSQFKGNWVLRLMLLHTIAVLGFMFSLISWALPMSVKKLVLGKQETTEVTLKHKLRIRSDAYMFSPKYCITVELVSPGMTFLSKPKVFHTITEEWSIGDFFDKEGYVYPPALKKKVSKLLKDVMDKAKK